MSQTSNDVWSPLPRLEEFKRNHWSIIAARGLVGGWADWKVKALAVYLVRLSLSAAEEYERARVALDRGLQDEAYLLHAVADCATHLEYCIFSLTRTYRLIDPFCKLSGYWQFSDVGDSFTESLNGLRGAAEHVDDRIFNDVDKRRDNPNLWKDRPLIEIDESFTLSVKGGLIALGAHSLESHRLAKEIVSLVNYAAGAVEHAGH
jgi:hypothetical protein